MIKKIYFRPRALYRAPILRLEQRAYILLNSLCQLFALGIVFGIEHLRAAVGRPAVVVLMNAHEQRIGCLLDDFHSVFYIRHLL